MRVAAFARASSTPPVSSSSRTRDETAPRGRRRERAAQVVVFRRGAYKDVDTPAPWTTTWTFGSRAIGLGVAKDDGQDATLCVDALVEPCGAHGFFIDARVSGGVRARCVCCERAFTHVLPESSPVDDEDEEEDYGVGFLAWLDPDATEQGVSGDYEVFPFPVGTEELDVTSLVRDSVVSFGLPEEFVCVDCDDDDTTPRSWSVPAN